MLYWLSQKIVILSQSDPYWAWFGFLENLRFITLRSALAGLTAFLIGLFLGKPLIRFLKKYVAQNYTDCVDTQRPAHEAVRKIGVPTMGGLLIITACYVSTLLWAQLNGLVMTVLAVLFGLMVIGAFDDFRKTRGGSRREGISPGSKLLLQCLVFVVIVLILLNHPETKDLISHVVIPFSHAPSIVLSPWFACPLYVILMVAFSNGVNIADGMDGLAIGLTMAVIGVLIVVTYVASHYEIAQYLNVPHVRGAGELTVFCAALGGASLAFYWYNAPPAEIFMGDTGSLPLGGIIAAVAILVHQPIVVSIAGLVILTELVSSLLQIASSQLSRRFLGRDIRVFRRAPLHHHFQLVGLSEEKIVARFYVIAIICALIAVSTLKIR